MNFSYEFLSGAFLWLQFDSHLLIFVCNPRIVVACLFSGIFPEQVEIQWEAAEIYTVVFLLQL